MSFLKAIKELDVPEVETKTPVLYTEENLRKLEEALVAKFGDKAFRVNEAIIRQGGRMPDGSLRVPLALSLRNKPGGGVVCWRDRQNPDQMNVVWSGIVTSSILDEAGIERL